MSFESDMKNWIKKVKDNVETVVVETRFECSDRIINTTPYDTIVPEEGGTAKANWNASIGNADESTTSARDKTGDKTKQKAHRIASGNISKDFYLTNSLAYIGVLEYGGYPNPPKKGTYLTSKQSKDGKTGPGYFKFSQGGYSAKAPNGMVRLVVADFDNIVLDIVRKL